MEHKLPIRPDSFTFRLPLLLRNTRSSNFSMVKPGINLYISIFATCWSYRNRRSGSTQENRLHFVLMKKIRYWKTSIFKGQIINPTLCWFNIFKTFNCLNLKLSLCNNDKYMQILETLTFRPNRRSKGLRHCGGTEWKMDF